MASLANVCDALNVAVSGVLQPPAVSFPVEVFSGWPVFEHLTHILEAKQAHVIVMPTSSVRDTTRFPVQWMHPSVYPVTLTAVVSGLQITFGGTAQANTNVNTTINQTTDVLVRPTGADTPSTVATKVAAAIVAQAIPGVTASAVGPVVTVSGANAHLVQCQVGGSVTASAEVRRLARIFQVNVYGPSADYRNLMEDLILTNVGHIGNPFLNLPDGTTVWTKYKGGPSWDDRMAMDTMFMSSMLFECEYPTLQTQTMTQVGSINLTITEQLQTS